MVLADKICQLLLLAFLLAIDRVPVDAPEHLSLLISAGISVDHFVDSDTHVDLSFIDELASTFDILLFDALSLVDSFNRLFRSLSR